MVDPDSYVINTREMEQLSAVFCSLAKKGLSGSIVFVTGLSRIDLNLIQGNQRGRSIERTQSMLKSLSSFSR